MKVIQRENKKIKKMMNKKRVKIKKNNDYVYLY